jgi:Secretion system C-terminal sorting domain/SprB repeat
MKFKILIFYLLAISICQKGFDQTTSWLKQISGTGDITPYIAKVDKSNNIYVIGNFTGQIHQGSFTLNSYGGNDGFVAKFDNSGTLLWIKQIGGNGNEALYGIALDNGGNNIYVAGTFQYKCKFSPSDSLVVTGTQDATNTDVFLAKYSLDGTLQSVKKIAWGLNTTDDPQNLKTLGIDKNGKLLIAGTFRNRIYFVNDSLVGGAILQNYIAKINEDGSVINKKLISGTDGPSTAIYSMDVCNNAYFWAGYYKNNLTFDIGTISSNGGTVDMFVYKTDFNLNGQWIRKISGTGSEICSSISCDSLNNIYVGGYFNTTSPGITIDSTATLTCAQHPVTHGGYDIFYAKYQPNGKLDWYHTAGSAGASPNNDDDIFRALYGSGVFVVAGKFGGNFTYRNHNLTYTGGTGTDVLGIVHDNKDNLIYALGFGGTGNDIGETAAIDNLGNYYFIGDFASASLTLGSTTLTNGGGKDLFITKYPKGSLDKVVTNVKCKGTSTGSIVVTPHGPLSTPFTYAWTKAGDGSFSSNNDSLFNLSAGTYRVLFTDGAGFSFNDSVVISEPATAISITLDSAINVACKNDTSGKIYIKVQGGISPYAYQWGTTNGSGLNATIEDQLRITAGTYNVYVTDANNCVDSLKNITVTQPATKVAITGAVVSVIHGASNDGAVNLTVAGGTQYAPPPPYHYSWTGPSGFTATTEDISSLVNGGNYSVTVTDKLGCKTDTTVLVPDTTHFFVKVISQNNVSCNGGSDGNATIQAVNAKGAIQITWMPGNLHTATVNGLTAQTYTVTVADLGRVAPDSLATTTVIITQPSTALNSGFVVTNLKCYGINDGSINLTVSGGTLPYAYQWTKNGVPYSTTEDLANLFPATYAYIVTDANGCTTSGSTPVTSATQISIVSSSIVDQTCNQGRNDGSINLLTVNGGTPYAGPQYNYTWSNGVSGMNVKSISLLSPNTYGVTINDASNCAINALFVVNAGPAIGGSITKQDVTCHDASDGQATMNPSFQGGRSLLSYLWTDPAQDTTQTVINLSPGSYTVIVTDNKGCEGYFNTNIANKVALSLSEDLPSHINVTCHGGNNGQLGVIATGGSGLYEYQLNGDGWFNSNIYSTLTAGKYKVVLRDRNAPSCQYSGLDSITISEPAPLVVNLAVNPGIINCAGTPVTFTATAGLLNYDFKVGGITVQSGASNTYVTSTLVSGNIVTVTGTNASGCSNTSLGITMTVNPNPVVIASVIHQVSCNGAGDGMARVVASGATAPYNFSWNSSPVQTNDTAINLSPGMYKVSVTDFKGCGPVADSVVITQMPALNLTEFLPSHKNVNCNGDHTGSFMVVATGGSGNYEYAVNSLSNWVATSQFSNDFAGMYKVLVRDANATTCVYNGLDSIAITEPSPITAVILSHDISCFGRNDGMAVVQASGGTGTLHLLWNDPSSSTNDTIFNLSPATYQVSITDDSSCNKIFSVTINEPALFSLSVLSIKNTKCSNDSTGAINISATGGRLPYSFTWSNGATTQNLDLIPPGNYSVNATDSSGCMATLSTSVSGATPINATIVADTITCYGNSTGKAIATTSGGTGKLHPVWNDPLNTQSDTIANVPAGNYILTLVDDSSCSKMFATEIFQLDSLYLNENSADHIDAKCNGTATGSCKLLASGGSGKYEFTSDSTAWTTDSIFTDLKAGSYRFILRDQKYPACYYNEMPSVIIDQPLPLTVSKPVVTTTSTWTSKDGTISVTASGGPGQLNYTLYPGEITNQSGTFTVGLGNYMIAVSDGLGCDTILSDIAYVGPFPDAVGQNPILYKLDIYPNPSRGLFNITYVNPAASKMVTEVYDILGTKIFIKEFTNKSGDSFNEKIDLEAKPKGIYFIRINGVTFKDKLVIQ